MSGSLIRIVEKFQGKKILVIGDVMLDEYVWGKVSRISPEAPVPVVEVQSTSSVPGGAANVAANISSLGGKSILIGIVGSDEAGKKLKDFFVNNGVDIEGLTVDQQRPTTVKTRIIAHNQQVVRIDREQRIPIDSHSLEKLLTCCLKAIEDVDAILVSDYAKGITAPLLLQEIVHNARNFGKPIIVDPKGLDFSKYKGVTVITPNQTEASVASGKEIANEDELIEVGKNFLNQLACRAVLITRGDRGMSLLEDSGKITHLPTMSREVYDVTGAGDTVAATFTLGYTTGAELVDCAKLSNYSAKIVVGRVGTSTVTKDELIHLLRGFEGLTL